MTASTRPDKLSLVVFSGEIDKVHYALVTAAAAAAIGTPVTLFFTMWASRTLFGTVEVPSWTKMASSDGLSGAELDQGFAAAGVATFAELLESCVALGAKLWVCEMGLKALGATANDLRPDLPITVTGMVTFLNDASKDGTMLFI